MMTVANPYHQQNGGRSRSSSFANIDEVQASGILEDIIRENQVYLGGSSIGKGFNRAALKYIEKKQTENEDLLKGHPDLNPNLLSSSPSSLVEESFYVVDIGIIVSQVYQWRKCFPRVEPFYAVKCNPDPVIIKTLALLGCNFDCASATEIDIVQSVCHDLRSSMNTMRKTTRLPEIIYANPCKSRKHIIHAVTKGVTMTTFDNVSEVIKCASISNKIQLVLRIVTDDTGSQCRLSSKYGAPKARWRNLLKVAQQYSMQVIGVSFHVGSGCHDASRYFQALQDARELFDIAKSEFGFNMTLLDIGGGFPGETHSFWNPEVLDNNKDAQDYDDLEVDIDDDDDDDSREGLDEKNGSSDHSDKQEGDNTPYMFFLEIAEQVAPMIDKLFPPNVRVIGEPGRYFVAAAATLVTSIVGSRSNEIDHKEFVPEPISDAKTSQEVYDRSRKDEHAFVRSRGRSFDLSEDGRSTGSTDGQEGAVWDAITEELGNYAKFYTKQNFVTQATDAYNDGLDLYNEDFDTAADLLGIPDENQMKSMISTVEGMSKTIAVGDAADQHAIISLAGAGEAAVSGMVLQAVADSAPLQDDYAYYVNDGVYGAFNNLMFDHATVRPRVLRIPNSNSNDKHNNKGKKDQDLYASTVFGPTCDSIDVITRSVLLPKLKIGDWLYFQNMGAYTMAAASSFNGFVPSEIVYVCSVQPEYFEGLIAGPIDKTTTTSKTPDDEKHTAKDDEKKMER